MSALFRPDRVLVVAELAQSYEGSFADAEALVRAAAAAGADAVKFQIFTADELAIPGYEYYELYKKLEFGAAQWGELFAVARSLGVLPIADVFGVESAAMLAANGIAALKLHAADMRNFELLRAVSAHGRPVFLSCGGSTHGEIAAAVDVVRAGGAPELCLLHGFQASPTRAEDTCFRRVTALREAFGLPVGFADHIDGEHELARVWPLLALTAGASVIEKHFTLRRADQKEDYLSALNPDEFADMVRHVRLAEQALGPGRFELPPAEREYREGFRKRVVAGRSLRAGHTVQAADVVLRRAPGSGGFFDIDAVVGRRLRRALEAPAPFVAEDLEPAVARPRLVATLACRSASARLYAKPLHRLDELTILEHLIARIRSVPRIDGIVLAISEGRENEAYFDVAARLGLPYIVGDEHDVQGRLIAAGERGGAELLFRATTECPFIYTDNIEAMVAQHVGEGAALTVCEGLPEGTYAEIITLASLRDAHDRGERRHRSELCTLYMSEHPERYKILRLKAPAALHRPEIRLTVDYPEDLVVCRAVAEALGKDGPLFPLEAIIAFLDARPTLKAVNGWIDAGTGRIWA